MLNYLIGFGIGYVSNAGLKRIETTWVRRVSYFVGWFVIYAVLIGIGAAIAESAGHSINGPIAASLANGMTIGLVISAFAFTKKNDNA